jgi:transcriptional regulator with PAS, ATPase and Fis domain
MINVDLQVIAASNRNIKGMIEKGEFREDLYYRLKVVDLHLPPLRDRKEDIPELIGYFVNKFNMQMGKNVTDVSQEALKLLINYNWPGNIRELSNSIERAILFCDGARIIPADLPLDIANHK